MSDNTANTLEPTEAQEARTAIERLYIEMRHIFNSGSYRPSGISGHVLQEALFTLNPEIYGSIRDPYKVELDGLVYVIDRLPKGIEACRFINLTSEEGYLQSDFELIIPPKRRRNCYRIDASQMFIEVTRGRSEIYDILTHLTFLYCEASKIRSRAFDEKGKPRRDWLKLEELVQKEDFAELVHQDLPFAYISNLLGRTFEESKKAYKRLAENPESNSGLFAIVYWLGRLAAEELFDDQYREISFTPTLRERIGRHIYGEKWASNLKHFLYQKGLHTRPIHIISANMHSILNALFAYPALREYFPDKSIVELAIILSKPENEDLMQKVNHYAKRYGLHELNDYTGTNISLQIFDTAQIPLDELSPEIQYKKSYIEKQKPLLIVMDYAFGEQAFETMDELLKPFQIGQESFRMPVESISIMGKAGILEGGKGDIMIPNAHVFEGTADNYPFENDFKKSDFKGQGVQVFKGPMITVLGTSLQNKDVLTYFRDSSWRAIGLEMEGAHYQKAIQAQAQIRKNINHQVTLRYAYYASDNPLLTGSTLASGSLGLVGVKPTYLISLQILKKILKK